MPMIIRNNIRYAGGSGGSNGSGENIVELTQAEYDALGDVVNSDNITYYITDADERLDASSVAFDDTENQLGASDVQGAISKLNSNLAKVVTLLDNVSWSNKTTHTLASDINNFKYLVVRIKCNYTSVTDVFHVVNTIPVMAIDKNTQINLFDILIGTDTKLRAFITFSDTTVYLVSDTAKYGIQNISIWGMN